MEIELGDTVKCKYTGYKGVAIGKTEFINGCVQYTVVAKWREGKIPELAEMQVDEESLDIIKKKEKPKGIVNKRNGGPTRMSFKQRGY